MSLLEVEDALPLALDGGPDDERSLAPISDEELTAQALAADPDAAPDPDAVPLTGDQPGAGLLPAWYMPVAGGVSRKRWHKALVIAAIVGFLVINVSGFCITYGLLEGA